MEFFDDVNITREILEISRQPEVPTLRFHSIRIPISAQGYFIGAEFFRLLQVSEFLKNYIIHLC